jgi:hypothetical protein
MTELKPCPFCGGATVTYVCEDGFNVGCSSANNCLARPFIIERTLEEAASIWNTRAAPRTDGDDGELVESLTSIGVICAITDQAAAHLTALSAEVERLKEAGRFLIGDCDCIGMKSPMLENFRQALGAKP